jgi:hypothetical protein
MQDNIMDYYSRVSMIELLYYIGNNYYCHITSTKGLRRCMRIHLTQVSNGYINLPIQDVSRMLWLLYSIGGRKEQV